MIMQRPRMKIMSIRKAGITRTGTITMRPKSMWAGIITIAAITHMRHFNKVRVPYFQGLLAQARHQKADLDPLGRDIVRMPGNPMLRYVGGDTADCVHPNQEKLKP